MRKKFLIPVILMSCALMMSACGKENTITENTTPSVEETVEVEETEETTPVVEETEETVETEETTPVETEEAETEETEEVEETTPVETEETTPTTQPTQPTNPEPTQPQPTQPEPVQPPHTHHFVGGDCTHQSMCECGEAGSYGSHNWNTRTWTEEIYHEGETITTYINGTHCKECGFADPSSRVVKDHLDATGHIGWSGCSIPVTTTTEPWTEPVNHSETTCSICGARQ